MATCSLDSVFASSAHSGDGLAWIRLERVRLSRGKIETAKYVRCCATRVPAPLDCDAILICTQGEIRIELEQGRLSLGNDQMARFPPVSVVAAETTGMEFVCARLERAAAAPQRGRHNCTPTVHATRGMAGVLSKYLRALIQTQEDIEGPDRKGAEQVLLQMADATVKIRQSEPEWQENPLVKRAAAFIENELHNPDLRPADIVAHLRVSRSHLYRQFPAQHGLAWLIGDIRLQQAYQKLVQTRALGRQIQEIAFACGFRSVSQFNRAFKSKYGCTPSQVQQPIYELE